MSSGSARLNVLHMLRLRGLIEVAELSRLTGEKSFLLEQLLRSESEREMVVHRNGRLSGWTLTPVGRAEGERLLAGELEQSGERPSLELAYREFLPMNSELLSICSAWQTVAIKDVHVLNDHTDPVHDEAVMVRLDRLHPRAVALVGRLEVSSGRFAGYGRRLSAAHARIASGETEWLTRSTIDSYHSIWFELHENLLATLGKRRSEERQR